MAKKREIDKNSPANIKKLKEVIRKKQEFDEQQKTSTKMSNELIEQTKKWCTVYRRNWELYMMMELDINLREFQQVEIHNLGVADTFFSFSSRGTSKTFKGAACAVTQCLLYPHSEIVISSTTITTANKFVKDKIEDELCGRISPKLKYFVKNKLITFKYDDDACIVNFFNGSWIKVLTESDSSVGSRITAFYAEEARRSKLSIVDRVFLPMRRARQAEFLNNIKKPEYSKDPRLLEKSKTVYLTSMAYKFEPIWKRWVSVVENAFNSEDEVLGIYDFMIIDVYAALKHNFITLAEYFSAKSTSSPMEFEMEYLNHSPQETDGAFYDLQLFLNNCVLEDAFIPPTPIDWIYKHKGKDESIFRKKKKDEYRVVYVDFAFVDNARNKNDLTVIGCMSGYPNKNQDKLLRNVDYLTTFSGGDKDETLKAIRRIFFFYEADYLVVDIRNGGADRIQDLSKSFYDDEMGREFRGFGFYNNENIIKYFYGTDKLKQAMTRVIDKDALPVIIPVAASDERNDNYHRQMRETLIGGNIRFLKDTSTMKRILADESDSISFNSEELADRLIPHLQTELLIQEAIRLNQKIVKGAYIKLVESGTATKDRIIATEYANYLFYLLESEMLKDNNRDEGIDLDDFALVF